MKLKIAIFCTNEHLTPPPKNVIYAPLNISLAITEGLVKRGHQVYLFAAKGSKTKAHLITGGLPPLKKNPFFPKKDERVVNFYEQRMLSLLFEWGQKRKFDLIHIHPVYRALPFVPLVKIPVVFTLHDPLNDPLNSWKKEFLKIYKDTPAYFVSLSNAQRKEVSWLNYGATIYNGIDLKKFKLNLYPKDYFFSAGRIRREKGTDQAVKACFKAKERLLFAGPIEDKNYWQKEIKPYLNKKIKYLGILSKEEIINYYALAKGFLFPIKWEEPFGLVMIEAMACGTPVIAYQRGSVPEIVKDKKTGFIVKNLKEMIRAMGKINQIKRENCRKWIENNFSEEKMVDNYEKLFLKIVKKKF